MSQNITKVHFSLLSCWIFFSCEHVGDEDTMEFSIDEWGNIVVLSAHCRVCFPVESGETIGFPSLRLSFRHSQNSKIEKNF